MEKFSFGDVVYTESFPFMEDRTKGRAGYAFVLEDRRDSVYAIFLTSNPENQSVRLGALADNRVTNMVAHRAEVLQKSSP